MVGEPMAVLACGYVDAAAGGEAGDDFRRPRGIILGGRRSRQDGGGFVGAGVFVEFPAMQKFIVERPPVGSKLSQLPQPA
jgi:hypothetical protein